MMKRNILAVVIPALLAAGAANAAEIYNKDGNKLDLYGKVDARHQFSDDDGSDGDESYVRFGFKGETQINDQLTGYGQWEYNIQANNSEGDDAQSGNKTRLGFAGLKFGDAGSIDYGRNYGLVYDAIGWTDMLPVFGGDWGGSDSFMNGRSTGLLTYRNTNFFGLVDGWDFAAQYQGKNERTAIDRANGDGYAFSTSYTLPIGVGIVGAYSSSDRTNSQAAGVAVNGNVVGQGKRAENWATALKYDANNVYLAALYGEGRNSSVIGIPVANTTDSVTAFANKSQTIELVAQYQFDFGLRPSFSYVKSKGKDLPVGRNGYSDADLAEYITAGASYYFNKNFSVYGDYRFNLLDESDFTRTYGSFVGTDNQAMLGVAYQF